MKAIQYDTAIIAFKEDGEYEEVLTSIWSVHPLPRSSIKTQVMYQCEGYVTFGSFKIVDETTATMCSKCGKGLNDAIPMRTQNVRCCAHCNTENPWPLDEGQKGIGYTNEG